MRKVLDEFTREAISVAMRSKMSANDLLDALYPLSIKHGKPEFMRSDNGPEFVATQLRKWLQRVCQTNQLKHQKPGERALYEAIRERHSVRAASRLILKVLRCERDLCELK